MDSLISLTSYKRVIDEIEHSAAPLPWMISEATLITPRNTAPADTNFQSRGRALLFHMVMTCMGDEISTSRLHKYGASNILMFSNSSICTYWGPTGAHQHSQVNCKPHTWGLLVPTFHHSLRVCPIFDMTWEAIARAVTTDYTGFIMYRSGTFSDFRAQEIRIMDFRGMNMLYYDILALLHVHFYYPSIPLDILLMIKDYMTPPSLYQELAQIAAIRAASNESPTSHVIRAIQKHVQKYHELYKREDMGFFKVSDNGVTRAINLYFRRACRALAEY